MNADNKITVEPVSNLHRVTGTSPSGDNPNKRKPQQKGVRKPSAAEDETIESKIGEQDDDETFHVIDYKA
jgi:hypothetical protein